MLTQAQFDALSELLRLREGSSARELARLHYVAGWDRQKIAQETGATPQKIYDAIKRVERGLTLARAAAGQ